MLRIQKKPIILIAFLFISCQLLAQSPSPYLYTTCSPAEGTPESGPECYDVSGYDPTNGGPNTSPCAFESITVGQTVTGHANGLDIFDNDIDWYELYLDGTEVVEVSLCANFYSTLLIYDDPCNDPNPTSHKESPANNKYSIKFGDCGLPLPAGYYHFAIESQIYPLIPCGESAKYSVSVNYTCDYLVSTYLPIVTLDDTDPGSLICDNRLGHKLMLNSPGTIGVDYEFGDIMIAGPAQAWGSDLEVNLISPSGTVLEVFHDTGGEETEYFQIIFLDGYPNVSTGVAPFNTDIVYEPLGGSANDIFAGESITGEWIFEICDNSPDGLPIPDAVPSGFSFHLFPLAEGTVYCNSNLEGPVIETPCPDDIILYGGAQTVTWTPPTATDNCNAPVVSSSDYPGDFFEIGTHTVTYSFTDFANLTTRCNFDIIIYQAVAPLIELNIYNLPPFCQGIKELYAEVTNLDQLTAPITYAWSHNLGTEQSVIAILNNTSYSVTVTDANGSSGVATYDLNVDMSNLLSAHVLIADEELEMENSEVQGGGVGLMDADEDVNIHNNSHIDAFLKSDYASIDGTSTVGNYIDEASTLALPPFISNPYYNYTNIVVSFGTTMTLSGTNYGKITVMPNATLIFNNPNVYINSLITKSKATISFNQATNIMVRRRVNIGSRNIFNASNQEVIMYVGDDFKVGQGSTIKADVFAREEIEVNESGAVLFTYMSGLFISKEAISSGDKVIWTWNIGCGASVSPAQLIAQVNTGEVQITTETKELSVYPNPSRGIFTLGLSNYMDKNIDIMVYNTLGKIVWQSHIDDLGSATLSIDLSDSQFPDGLYLLSVTTEGAIETKSMVLNR